MGRTQKRDRNSITLQKTQNMNERNDSKKPDNSILKKVLSSCTQGIEPVEMPQYKGLAEHWSGLFKSHGMILEWDNSINEKPIEYFVANSETNNGFWEIEDPKILEDYLKNKLLEYNLTNPPSQVGAFGIFSTIYRSLPIEFFAVGINAEGGLIWKYTGNIYSI
jgi:hypothetical protein